MFPLKAVCSSKAISMVPIVSGFISRYHMLAGASVMILLDTGGLGTCECDFGGCPELKTCRRKEMRTNLPTTLI